MALIISNHSESINFNLYMEMNPSDYFEAWIPLMPDADTTQSPACDEELAENEKRLEEYLKDLNLSA